MGCLHPKSKNDKNLPRRDVLEFESTVLVGKEAKKYVLEILEERLKFALEDKSLQVALVVRGSDISFEAKKFHELSNGLKNTLLIVKTTKNRIFGGFTPCEWKDQVMYKFETDEKRQSFLFTLEGNEEEEKKKVRLRHRVFGLNEKDNAIMNCQNQGPIFGAGHDLHLTDGCNKNENWANMGKSYASQYKFGSDKANCQLAGQIRFLVEEFELFEFKLE